MSERLLTDFPFRDLDLEPALLKGIEAAGFTHCTPIQAAALPKLLAGTDVAGQALTGTGKTAAYLLAAMNRLLRSAPATRNGVVQPRTLIIAPTRELAVQIERDAQVLGRHADLRLGVVYGGTGYDSQREMLKAGVDILVGTPGRLIDYYKQKIFTLDHVLVAVVDEADRMFDLGFIRDIRYLLRRMPPPTERLNMLFTATLSLRVQELAYEHMNAPVVIDTTNEQVTVERVKQVLYHVASNEKIGLLLGLLKHTEVTRTLVFVNTKRAGEDVEAYLLGNDLEAGLLSGDVPQKQRLRLLDRFSSGELPILVATDVAARGLHIPDVSHVVNFDLPQDPEDYVHRVGRTARAGKGGDAVSLACERYVYSLPEIERYIGQRIPAEVPAPDRMVTPRPPLRRTRRRPRQGSPRGGGRPAGRRSGGKRRPRSPRTG